MGASLEIHVVNKTDKINNTTHFYNRLMTVINLLRIHVHVVTYN
jgi:hypothetical protein